MRLSIAGGPRHGCDVLTTVRGTAVAITVVAAAATLVGCGFGTAPGPPYDFNRLERVVEPILRINQLTVVNRQQTGTDCHGMSCARPRLNYDLRSAPPATFETVQELLAAFDGITKPFSQVEVVQDRDPANPRRWAFTGEVMRHGVQVWGEVTGGGEVFGPGAGTADVIHLVVWADRLAVP